MFHVRVPSKECDALDLSRFRRSAESLHSDDVASLAAAAPTFQWPARRTTAVRLAPVSRVRSRSAACWRKHALACSRNSFSAHLRLRQRLDSTCLYHPRVQPMIRSGAACRRVDRSLPTTLPPAPAVNPLWPQISYTILTQADWCAVRAVARVRAGSPPSSPHCGSGSAVRCVVHPNCRRTSAVSRRCKDDTSERETRGSRNKQEATTSTQRPEQNPCDLQGPLRFSRQTNTQRSRENSSCLLLSSLLFSCLSSSVFFLSLCLCFLSQPRDVVCDVVLCCVVVCQVLCRGVCGVVCGMTR